MRIIEFAEKRIEKLSEHDPDRQIWKAYLDGAIDQLNECGREEQKNVRLTLEELQEMDGQPVWLDNGVSGEHRWKCYIVNNEYEIHGRVVPCGIDMWGLGTSLSLIAQCDVYRHPFDGEKDPEVAEYE